ncbi:peptide chain release factor 3, partial [Pseudonocardia sp. KRD-169]|nr:peptide chain release factor 3 [Pseudonocardia abyssalis]
LVFKVQAGMDRSHRDRTAFLRINSGRFERGMVLTHAGSGKPFATKYAQAVFGQQRTTLEEAFPGDIVGLVNAGALRPGDTLYAEDPVEFPAIPSFAPEFFAVVRAKDAGRYKQFRRGISQLDSEGVIQVLRSDRRGDQAPVLAAVGPLQFEVVTARLADEFSAPVTLEQLNYNVARLTDEAGAEILNKESDTEVLHRSVDGALLAVFVNKWRMETIRRKHSDVMMEPLLAGAVDR